MDGGREQNCHPGSDASCQWGARVAVGEGEQAGEWPEQRAEGDVRRSFRIPCVEHEPGKRDGGVEKRERQSDVPERQEGHRERKRDSGARREERQRRGARREHGGGVGWIEREQCRGGAPHACAQDLQLEQPRRA